MSKTNFSPGKLYLISDENHSNSSSNPNVQEEVSIAGVIDWSVARSMMRTYQDEHPKILKWEDEITKIKTPLHGLKIPVSQLKQIIKQDDVEMDEIAVNFAINHKHLDRLNKEDQYLTVVFVGVKNNSPYTEGIAINYCEPIP